MKVFVKGSGEVSLTQQHYVATGGQASVYVRSGTAYKIYTDPKNMVPEAKLSALLTIQDTCVIKPQNVLLDPKSNAAIGYTMNAVADNYSLCQLFTKAFRDRNGITNDHIVGLTAKLRKHVENVHKAGVLIVDLNELNVLTSNTFNETYLIDVDSFQTKGYPATVIMPSVRDYSVSSKNFSELSDWFSYGILAFQLFVGIHPYRGRHLPTETIPSSERLEHRMKGHISAFRSDVGLPKCCYPFSMIPQNFRDWLKAVLEDGQRVAPPDPHGGPAVVLATPQMVPISVGSGNILLTDMFDLEGWRLVSYAESGTKTLALVQRGNQTQVLLSGHVVYQGPALPGTTLVGFTPKMNQPVGLNLLRGKITFFDYSRKTQESLGFNANELNKSGDLFYVRNGSKVLEVEFSELQHKILVTASHAVADVLEMASHLYEGVVLQNMIGSAYASLFPKSKHGYQVRLPELDKYKILEAKFDGGVLMVLGARKGEYDRLVFRFDDSYQTYDLDVVTDITPAGLNFVTLPTGICVVLTEAEKIEAFSSKKGGQGLKAVSDPVIDNNMRLLKVGGKVGFERAGKLYQMSLKN